MNEKRYKKRLDIQSGLISRQSELIKKLKSQNEMLEQRLKEKDEQLLSVEPLRKELTESIQEHKKLKSQYQALIDDLKLMKNVFDKDVLKKRWWIIKWLIK